MIKNKKVLILEIIGAIFIVLIGAALHFTFALSGKNFIVGAFSAVNESVWEHLKLPFWPSLLWLIMLFVPLRKEVANFFSAKTIGTVSMLIIIPVVFYSYTMFTKEILAVDIATFIVAVIVGQAISYKLYQSRKGSRIWEILAIIVLLSLATIFIIFTYYPPHLPIFMDSETCTYGIG